MFATRHSSRTCALALALVLPAVGIGELALHLREPSTRSAIESRHEQTCVRLHDHRICTLVQRSPWAPAESQPPRVDCVRVELDVPSDRHPPRRQSAHHQPRPRAPPSPLI